MSDSTALVVTTPEYADTAKEVASLRHQFEDVVYEVTTRPGMQAAIAGRRQLIDLRVGLEKIRQSLKAPLLAAGQVLDAEAKRITAIITPLEESIDFQIKAEERRKEDARRERLRILEEHVAQQKRRIDAIRQLPLGALHKTVGGIMADIITAQSIEVEVNFDPEYQAEAQIAIDETVQRLHQMRTARAAADAEAKRLEAEKAELAEARRVEDARIAAENAARAEAQRIEDEARAEEQRQAEEARAARQREEDEARAARQRAEDAERARVAEEERAAREKAAAAERAEQERIAEQNRAEAERLAEEGRAFAARAREEAEAALAAEIASATLVEAAREALAWMDERMYGHEPAALKLKAALEREENAA